MKLRIVGFLVICFVALAQTKVVPEEFLVKPGTVRFWRFNATNSGPAGETRIEGRFRAQGGSGNDIQVIVAEWDDCDNWINGHAAPAVYASGKVTTGKFDVILGAGQYCIAFNNRMSAVSAKEISAQIFLIDR